MMEEEFITRKPLSKLLRNSISYYYFHRSNDPNYVRRFVYYPNSKNALTVYANARIDYYANGSDSEPDHAVDVSCLYSGIQTVSRTAKIVGPFNKIGVVFTELGINHFIDVPLNQLVTETHDMSFSHFDPEGSVLFRAVFDEESLEHKVQLLDAFFSEKFRGFEETRLISAVTFIVNARHKISVSDVAKHCELNGKTMLRLFQKHLCCTPKEYINIVQFRGALSDYLSKNQSTSLTALALENDYYDQAQFIQHFKKMTNVNPRFFFRSIEQLGDEGTFWMFK